MVQVRKITKTEMKELYKEDMLFKIVNLGNALYAQNVKGQADNVDGYEVVWCDL